MLNPDQLAKRIRRGVFDEKGRKFLLADLKGSNEEKDRYTVLNCGGFGRKRVLKRFLMHLENASVSEEKNRVNFRTVKGVSELETQVFQIAGCNLRCWYCFVDDDRLSARGGSFFSADEMVEMYCSQEAPPPVLDLSGGDPGLVPEWVYDIIKALERRGLRDKVHVWVDDNLTSKIYWDVLSKKERMYIAETPNHCRAVCFKGICTDSFSATTRADPKFFDNQFDVFERYLRDNICLYGYVTFTNIVGEDVERRVEGFIMRLEDISAGLPKKIIPLFVKESAAMRHRLSSLHIAALAEQMEIFRIWTRILEEKYGPTLPSDRREIIG